MRWDKNLDIIVNKLSIKYSVDTNIVKDVVTTFFTIFKRVIQHPSMPTILIHNFGRFSPNEKKLHLKRRDFEAKLEGELSEEEQARYEEKLAGVNYVIARLSKEKTTRKDEEE